ncbi:hypothetical protein N0V82_007755 [Gnomoniopsis sp. IMI 355080]|nr:hypothetical protein N0V82_007755 [Gnomoniopsis sp. IMI 355080]
MSGFIAVSVSLIGLSGVLFTLAIFVQMILSFPAMLSSNSQTYVQQQRKTYHISASLEPEFEEMEMNVDAELEYEQEQEEYDDSVERWIDVVDEAMTNFSPSSEITQRSQRRRSVGSQRAEPITRGRPRRRRRRAGTIRPALRSKPSTWQSNDQKDYGFEVEQVPTQDRRHCNPAWRNRMAC